MAAGVRFEYQALPLIDNKATLVQISATKGRPTMATPSPCPARSEALKPGTKAKRTEDKPKTEHRQRNTPEGGGGGYQITLPPSVAAAKTPLPSAVELGK